MTEEALAAGIDVLLATTPPYCCPFTPPYWSEIVDLDRASSEILSLDGMLRSYAAGRGGDTHFPNGSCGRKMPDGAALLLCDLAADFLTLPETEYRSLFLDEIHPNKKGHARYAACIRACLDQL